MAWTYEQTFNSLSGGDLNGQDSWGGGTNNTRFDVQSSVVFEGANAVSNTQPGDASSSEIIRTVTGINSGIVYVSIRRTAAAGNLSIKLGESASSKMYVVMDTLGNIVTLSGALFTSNTIQAYSNDTWYRIGIEFDNVGQPNKFRANVDGGSFTSWLDVTNTSYTNIDEIHLDSSDAISGVTDYYDFISPNYTASATTNIFMPQL